MLFKMHKGTLRYFKCARYILKYFVTNIKHFWATAQIWGKCFCKKINWTPKPYEIRFFIINPLKTKLIMRVIWFIFSQGAPGNRGFPGSDGLPGPKVWWYKASRHWLCIDVYDKKTFKWEDCCGNWAKLLNFWKQCQRKYHMAVGS